ncbi:MAG: capsule assembly Wzi family protein [Bacteroidota bacterium]
MKTLLHLLCSVILLTVFVTWISTAQVENVPASHPVYTFLKRMDVKGIIERYRDAILPMSRKEVGEFLTAIDKNRTELTETEQSWLDRYLLEFRFDIHGTTDGANSLIASEIPGVSNGFGNIFSGNNQYLYAYHDSDLTMFVNGLLAFNARRINGDVLGDAHAEFIQGGGRIRGTLGSHFGYYVQGTNAQFWGSRDLLLRDTLLSQAQTLRDNTAQNFDMAEGYARYDGGIISAELGMERVLWGNGYDQKMLISDNIRTFPMIRTDIQFKSLKYTFMHGWLLGRPLPWTLFVSADSAAKIKGPYIADKYTAAHRIEFSFPRQFDIGFQEMIIYANRPFDLGYLNPFILLESVQRARGSRDHDLWALDLRTHFIPGLQFTGTLVVNDVHFQDFFLNRWYNRNAYQLGFFLTDPIGLPNTSLMAEWTHINPYTYSHEYSIEENYTSYGAIIGPRIGPNSESWFVRGDLVPSPNLTLSVSGTLVRHGDNILDAKGNLVKDVGGDIWQPHLPTDPIETVFLDGNLVTTKRLQFFGNYEIVHHVWLGGWFEWERIDSAATNKVNLNKTFGAEIRMEI